MHWNWSIRAALDGVGLAYMSEEKAEPHLADGTLAECWRTGANPIPAFLILSEAGVSSLLPCLP